MKNHFLIMCLAAALFAGCSKEPDTLNDNSPATHISAKAQGKGDIPMDTKAPLTGTSMDGLTADVYASTYDISGYKGSLAATFSGVYGHGTMTFGTDYVRFDASDFGGLNGGSTLLPSDGSTLYLYGFYPKGWTSVVDTPGDPTTTYENLYYIFDGKTDVMSSWLTSADDVKIKSEDATLPDRAILTFQHLLTRYTICVKASDATAATTWGRVKSVKIKDLDETNSAWCDKSTTDQPMVLVCMPHPTTTTPTAFYKLTGSDISSPTYSDTKFEATDYATSQPLTTTAANACYTMVAPIDIMDADPLTPELTLEVVTIDALGTELTSEIPVSLRQDKFPEVDGTHLTRGYSISLTLNFRVGMIQAIAAVDEWKEFGKQNIDVNRPSTRVKIGEFRDGGIVYWIDPADKKNYKILSLTEGSSLKWAASDTYVLGDGGGQDAMDGMQNMAAIKAYCEANKGTVGSDFSAAFPAAAFCDALNKDGVTGWYLPARAELNTLYNAYRENKSVIEAAIAANSGTAMTNGIFWSGTEAIDATNQACDCHFSSDGYTHQESKVNTLSVRCVKHIDTPAKIGAVKDGGIVYWVDPNDATKYSVLSMTEGNALRWWDKDVHSSLHANDEVYGTQNVAIMKAYYAANSATIGGDFSTVFPAAGFCEAMNVGGVRGWYLPASSELERLISVYFAHREVFDKICIANGGTATTDDWYFSSTEIEGGSGYGYDVWCVTSSFGLMEGYKSGGISGESVRCMKSTLPPPPPPPAIGDLRDGGIVYEVIGAKYKVFSLEQPKLAWSAKTTYVLGATGQNEWDGKKNVAAMKAYSAAHTGDSDNTTKTTGVLATDFPAAGFCEAKNTGGATGWYLPTLFELEALSTAYRANKAVLDQALTDHSGTAISASDEGWSGTEGSSSYAWCVIFSNGDDGTRSKSYSNSVRCVRVL